MLNQQAKTRKKSLRMVDEPERKQTEMPTIYLDDAIVTSMQTYDKRYDSYLRRTLGKVLPSLMMVTSEIQPDDGINFIAQALYKAAQDQVYLKARLAYTRSWLDVPPPDTNCKAEHAFETSRNEYSRSLKQELRALKFVHDHIDELPEDLIIVDSKLIPNEGATASPSTTERRLSRWQDGRAIKFSDEQIESISSRRNIQIGQIKLRLGEINRLIKIDEEEKRQRLYEEFLKRQTEITASAIEDMKKRMFSEHMKYKKEKGITSAPGSRKRSTAGSVKKETEEEIWKEMTKEAERTTEQESEEQIQRKKQKQKFREARKKAKSDLERALLRGDYRLTKDGIVVYCSADWKSIGLTPKRSVRQVNRVMEVDEPSRWGDKQFKCQVYLDHECYFPCEDKHVTLLPKIDNKKQADKKKQESLKGSGSTKSQSSRSREHSTNTTPTLKKSIFSTLF